MDISLVRAVGARGEVYFFKRTLDKIFISSKIIRFHPGDLYVGRDAVTFNNSGDTWTVHQ